MNIAWDSDKKYKFSNGNCKVEGKCTVNELKESKYRPFAVEIVYKITFLPIKAFYFFGLVKHVHIIPEFKNFAKPKDWKKDLWELDTVNPENNGLQNEDLIVWMRTAALPNFRKLYRKIDHQNNGNDFKEGIPEGQYSLEIEYSKKYFFKDFC